MDFFVPPCIHVPHQSPCPQSVSEIALLSISMALSQAQTTIISCFSSCICLHPSWPTCLQSHQAQIHAHIPARRSSKNIIYFPAESTQAALHLLRMRSKVLHPALSASRLWPLLTLWPPFSLLLSASLSLFVLHLYQISSSSPH